MKKSYLTDKSIIFVIWIVTFALFIFTYGKMGSPYVDCGREAYIPWQMLKGEVLYRDIFNIYAPAAYFVNALLYKIFSPNLNVLYCAAFINYGIILTLLYLITRLFWVKQRTILLILFIIGITGMLGNVFNFMFPYSFGMIYGISSVLASVYFFVRASGKSYRVSDYYWAALFGGLAAAFKYEFVLYFIPLLFFSVYRLKSFTKSLKFVALYLFIPLVMIAVLLFQGLSFYDVLKEFTILREILNSRTMWYFYSASGISFSYDHIGLILITVVSFAGAVLLLRGNPLTLSGGVKFLMALLLLYFGLWAVKYRFFVFVPILVTLLFIIRFGKIDLKVKVLTVSTLFICTKVFFSLMLFSYGTYFIGLMLCLLGILLPVKYRKPYIMALFLCAIYFVVFGLNTLSIKTGQIDTPRGMIYAGEVQAKPFMQTYEYLRQNSNPGEKILCLPEEPMLNFMLERDTDNYLYSVIPMYVEVFGEYHIINRMDENKPEFIVISDWDTNSYYFRFFGRDYALGIMNYVNDNYDKVFETDYGLKHVVYRRKNNEVFTHNDKS